MTTQTAESDGLLWACRLDGVGGAEPMDWEGVRAWQPADGPMWIHVRRDVPAVHRWLREAATLDEVVCDALLAEQTRPRALPLKQGLLANLRGLNLNPGADPHDLLALRVWLDQDRIITALRDPLRSAGDVRQALDRRDGPHDACSVLVDLAEALATRLWPAIEHLTDRVDELEDRLLSDAPDPMRAELADVRRRLVHLRRFLAPQREALTSLATATASPFLTERHRLRIREIEDRLTRYIEDLDLARDRAAVAQDELAARAAERLNRNLYLLSIVAAVFLPLGLLTGLLGINVQGIPGADNPYAFVVVCALLVTLAGAMVWLFRRLHLL